MNNELIELNDNLYLLSDDKIKETGGYYYHPKNIVLLITEQSIRTGIGKKIIASTDPHLGLPDIKEYLKITQ